MSAAEQPLVLQAIDALKQGERRHAAALLEQDLKNGPPAGERWRNVSRLLGQIGEIDMAIEAARRAADPPTLDNLLNYWGILATYGRSSEALKAIERLPADVQNHPSVLHFRGTIATEQGRFEESEELLRRALAAAPDAFATWFALAMIKTFVPGDADIPAMEMVREQASRARPEAQARFLYALGKAYDDCGDEARAFDCYEQGAALRRGTDPYDAAKEASAVERTIRDFTDASFSKLTPSREKQQRSIFVTGLPRSGTTLVQQILLTHSRVADGDETNLFRPALIPTIDYSFPGALAYQQRTDSDDPWGDIARDYTHFIDMRFRSDGLVVDKTLGHTLLTGLLLHSLPEAKVIWLRRIPEDAALSCFRTYFTSRIGWTWSWTDIANHFRAEDRLFNHWRALFAERILAVPYEELVQEPRKWGSVMLGHVGLAEERPADDVRASGHNVRTASVKQVRDQVSTARIGAARAYQQRMDEFHRAYRA